MSYWRRQRASPRSRATRTALTVDLWNGDAERRFPRGSIEFDHALVMRDTASVWRTAPAPLGRQGDADARGDRRVVLKHAGERSTARVWSRASRFPAARGGTLR